ncbi:MAG: alpha/beta hydrolase [Chloroflexi bacterium]|nr:alpha/beta hydrolase [Chloroflexota bacterium]
MKRAYVDIPEGQVHYQTEGSGEPLLLLHQGMFSSDEFLKVAPIMAPHYRLIARDMLGYGMSDVNPPNYTIEDYAKADVSFMKAMGIKKTSIVGVHTGATLAVELALTHPEMVDRLVVYGLPSFEQSVREACIKSFTFSPVEVKEDGSHLTARLWKTTKKLGARAGLEDWNLVVLAAQMARGGAFHGEQAIFRYDEEKKYPQLKKPILIMSGTEDVFHIRMDALKRLIPHAEFRTIEQTDGFVTLEKPGEFAQAALDFLKKK